MADATFALPSSAADEHDPFLPVIPMDDHMAPHLLAAAAFLTGFTNRNTREAYALDLRLFFDYCTSQRIDPLNCRRYHLQAYVLHLIEVRKNAPASVCRRLGTVTGYYETAVEDGYLDASPAVRLKLPIVHRDPAKLTWLTRWELGAVMRAAQEAGPRDHAMIAIMATLGMRVSATCAIQIEDISETEGGYRTISTIGKGDKPSLKALPIPLMRIVEKAVDGRAAGPLFLRRDGSQMTRRSADRVVQRITQAAGVKKKISPHSLRRSYATLALKAGVPIHVVQHGMDHSSARTTAIYDGLGVEHHAEASHTIAALLASAA